MSMPFVQGFGDGIITGFGKRAELLGQSQGENLQRSIATVDVDLHDGLRGLPHQAAMASNEVISQGTRKTQGMTDMHADAGMQIGSRFNAAVDESTATLTMATPPTA